MAKKYLDNDGLLYFYSKLKSKFSGLVHTHVIGDVTGLQESLDEAGVIDDVYVDGSSVVGLDKIARVDLSGKVDKVSGKQLSTEDFTAAYKEQLDTLPEPGVAGGVCPLDSNTLVDPQYLPSYVDDVIEAYPISGETELSASWLSETPSGAALTPQTGKIYILVADSTTYVANTQFRWGGSTYVKLTDTSGISAITNAEIDTIVAS